MASYALNVHAAFEKRTYTKMSSSKAMVKIEAQEEGRIQAALYVDARENDQFINSMLSDKASSLAKLKLQIEKDFCSKNSATNSNQIEGCGEVTLTKVIRTSFSRGGWMSGEAAYTFLIGFTAEGTAKTFYATHLISFSENVNAQIKSDGTYSGVFLKTIELDKIKELEDNTP